ncbi:hypothetical protein F5I97DRAFT_1900186 [Phlebopus sp. FC_14]|nr:hypothetical protein F5I97DRAFT_1900186 [Phlebopus sp. FC_14]
MWHNHHWCLLPSPACPNSALSINTTCPANLHAATTHPLRPKHMPCPSTATFLQCKFRRTTASRTQALGMNDFSGHGTWLTSQYILARIGNSNTTGFSTWAVQLLSGRHPSSAQAPIHPHLDWMCAFGHHHHYPLLAYQERGHNWLDTAVPALRRACCSLHE